MINPGGERAWLDELRAREQTQTTTLTPLIVHCEHCGQPLSVANHGHRTVTTLAGMWKLTLVIRQCIQPDCPGFHQIHRPEEEGR